MAIPPQSEEEKANWLTFFNFNWVSELFSRGSHRAENSEPLEDDDLLQLPTNERAAPSCEAFASEWYVNGCGPSIDLTQPTSSGNTHASLLHALLTSARKYLIIGGVLRLLSDAGSIAAPFLLQQFVRWIGNYADGEERGRKWEGFVWCAALALDLSIASLLSHAHHHYTGKAFQRMRSSTIVAVYEKSLRLEGSHGATGLISQMHSTDTYKLLEMGYFFHQLWSAPVVIVAALVGLYLFIGWAGVLSLAIFALFVPFQALLAKAMMAKRYECAKIGDRRLHAVNEFLQGIRIVKFMCWEAEAEKSVQKIRDEEVQVFRPLYILRSTFVCAVTSLPMIVSFGVIAVAYAWGRKIEPDTIFPTLAMLNILRTPCTTLPMAIGKLVDLRVSLGRIQTFLQSPERELYLKELDAASFPGAAIVLQHANLQFRSASARERCTTLLDDVTLEIPKGKLTIIIGPTGAGKSVLVTAMLGEGVLQAGGTIAKCGEIAYVSQEAWIMNATLRDNVLMGRPYDEEKYLRVIFACQLLGDLEQLTASDMTEIGERGTNLSGGQKQRVAFARAVYSEREILLMDDPLSAVDAHVCTALFDQALMGVLQKHTRVLVTHQTQFLSNADHIIVVQEGKITFTGTYEQLLEASIDVSVVCDTRKSPDGRRRTPIWCGGRRRSTQSRSPGEHYLSPSPSAERWLAPHRCSIPTSPNSLSSSRLSIPVSPSDHRNSQLMTIETQQVGAISSSVYTWYSRLSGWGNIVFIALAFAVWRASACLADLIVSWWSSRSKVAGQTLTQDQYLYWYAIFVGLAVVWVALRQVPFVCATLRVAEQAHTKLLHNVLSASSTFFDTSPTGRLLNRFSKDMEAIDLVIPESLNLFFNMLLTVLGTIVIMIYSAYYVSVVLVVLLVLFFILLKYYLITNRAQKRLEANGRSPVIAIMNETLGGLMTIRTYNMGGEFSQRHMQRVDASARSTYSWRVSQRWIGVRLDWIGNAVVLLTGVAELVMMLTLSGATQRESVSTFSLAITYALSFGGTIGFLSTMAADLEAAMSSVERVKEYMEDIPVEPKVVYTVDHPRPPPSWPPSGEILFSNVDLRFRPGLPLVLKDVTFTIKAGQRVGVVGRTGSGKSTLTLALFRIVEMAAGQIRVDGTDIATLDPHDVRSKLTILPQDPVLFSGTIRSNLDPFRHYKEEEVWSALERVGMLERVKQDPNGVDACVTERGSNFSLGQRQLLCLARALLMRNKILIMDEATASVDFEADAMIQRTVREEFADCTVIVIAHRLATIIDADVVLVMEGGEVKEFDSPDRLLRATSSMFYGMVRQLGDEQFLELMGAADAAAALRSFNKSGGLERPFGDFGKSGASSSFEGDAEHAAPLTPADGAFDPLEGPPSRSAGASTTAPPNVLALSGTIPFSMPPPD